MAADHLNEERPKVSSWSRTPKVDGCSRFARRYHRSHKSTTTPSCAPDGDPPRGEHPPEWPSSLGRAVDRKQWTKKRTQPFDKTRSSYRNAPCCQALRWYVAWEGGRCQTIRFRNETMKDKESCASKTCHKFNPPTATVEGASFRAAWTHLVPGSRPWTRVEAAAKSLREELSGSPTIVGALPPLSRCSPATDPRSTHSRLALRLMRIATKNANVPRVQRRGRGRARTGMPFHMSGYKRCTGGGTSGIMRAAGHCDPAKE